MTQPTRLIDPDGEATPLERALLASALDERPSPEASRRILAATLAASSVAATTGLTSTAKAWLAIAAVAVGTAGAGVMLLDITDDPGLPSSTEKHDPTALLPKASEPLPPPPTADEQQADERPPETVSELTREPTVPEAQARRSSSPKPQTVAGTPAVTGDTNASTLREELELLDRARAAVQAGDAQRALDLLASYDRRFPHGMLRHESQLLRKRADEAVRR